MDKQTKRMLGRKIGSVLMRIFAVLTGVLPYWWSYFLGKGAGSIMYHFVVRYKKIALESLTTAFPDKPLDERQAIAKQSVIYMAQGALEVFYCIKKRRLLDDGVRIEGRRYLDEALKQKKGVIGLTAHFGNFPLMTIKLAREGYPVNAIARPMRDPDAGDFIYNLRHTFGFKMIFSQPRKEIVAKTLRALRDNELILIQMDQNFGEGGVWVDFFGKLAATPIGPIVFALRTDAVVVPVFIRHEGYGRHCIEILPAQPLIKTADSDETVLLNAAQFSKIIESQIRKHPSEWGWIHRRWKSQPSAEQIKERFKVQKV